MPKKFQGENTKSAAARARRAEAKAAADARKQKELEDAYWRDEDKHVMRREQRKVRGPGRAGPGQRSLLCLSATCLSSDTAVTDTRRLSPEALGSSPSWAGLWGLPSVFCSVAC